MRKSVGGFGISRLTHFLTFTLSTAALLPGLLPSAHGVLMFEAFLLLAFAVAVWGAILLVRSVAEEPFFFVASFKSALSLQVAEEFPQCPEVDEEEPKLAKLEQSVAEGAQQTTPFLNAHPGFSIANDILRKMETAFNAAGSPPWTFNAPDKLYFQLVEGGQIIPIVLLDAVVANSRQKASRPVRSAGGRW